MDALDHLERHKRVTPTASGRARHPERPHRDRQNPLELEQGGGLDALSAEAAGQQPARLVPARWIGLQGRLARPFWGLLASWAVVCGALASQAVRLEGESLLALALVLLLAEMAWGGLWDLAAGVDWFRPLAEGWPPAHPARWAGPPYTQPGSPAGRMVQGLNRLAGWWRASFWPAAGPALLGLVAAAGLALVLSLLLPARLRPLNAALVALAGLGLARRARGQNALAAQAVVQVGLSWLAGHLAFAPATAYSAALALAFVAAALGALQIQDGRGRGARFLVGGQGAAAALLIALEQPLAAGGVGLLLLGQVVALPPAGLGAEPRRVARKTWPWLMAAMLLATLALP